jgi:ferredoxin
VPTNKNAYERGLGEADINKIKVLGYQPNVIDDFKWPPNIASSLDMVPSFISKGLMRFWWSRPVIDPEVCTKCGKCVKNCPVEALSAGVKIPEFDYPECINCMCCMEMCPEKAVKLEKSMLSKLLSRND